jgi:plasmid stabilization system protein ParE
VPEHFILTPSAQRDMESIWQYIAADSIEAADNVESAIYRALIRFQVFRVLVIVVEI